MRAVLLHLILIAVFLPIAFGKENTGGLDEIIDDWIARPEVEMLLFGPFRFDKEQVAAYAEAKKLPAELVPVAVSRLERAETDDDKTALISLVGLLFREHSVTDSLQARARKVVRSELDRRPLQRTPLTDWAIKFLTLYGRISDLDALAPYIIYRKSDVSFGMAAWKEILKREGRTSPPVPEPLPKDAVEAALKNLSVAPAPAKVEMPEVSPTPLPLTLRDTKGESMDPPKPAHLPAAEASWLLVAIYGAAGLVVVLLLIWLAKRSGQPRSGPNTRL